MSGFLDTVKSVFTVYGGHIAADGTVTLTGAGKFFGWIAALAFIWAFATSGSTWIMGSDRTLAVACFDGVGPLCPRRSLLRPRDADPPEGG